MDYFQQGMMLGRVLELSERTASKVDTIEARQAGLIQRLDKLESDQSRPNSGMRVILALAAAASAGLANLKAEQVAELLSGVLRVTGSH